MKKATLILFGTMLSIFIMGQNPTIIFSYDNAGNRTNRTIVDPGKSPDTTITTPDSLFVKASEAGEEEMLSREEYQIKVGKQTIKIYPNPTTGFFTIKIDGWDNKTKATTQLTNLSGKRILEHPIKNGSTKIDIRGRPDGTYLLLVELNGKKETWKIVKK